MGNKFTYVVKDTNNQKFIEKIDSPYNIEHDAKSNMQNVIKGSQKIKNIPNGEYYVQTYRDITNEECGPSNSFIVKDGQITFKELPYGNDLK